MTSSQTPQASTSSGTNEMLLAYPSSHSSHGHNHSHLCHHHHHNQNSIRTPNKHSSPLMASMSLAESSYSSPSNTLIIDNMGELHDPSYMSALRSLHAEIGNRSSPKPEGGRRPSSSHAPSRPSQLGLTRGSPRDDDVSDSDSDYSDDDDNVYSIRSRSQDFSSRDNRSNSLASSTRPSFSHSNRVSSSGSQSQIAPTPPQTPPPPSSFVASRHLSMSSYDNNFMQQPQEKSRRASWAFRRKHDNSSPSSTPRSNALALAHEAEKKSNNDSWGFTGIVDIEREQRAARESLDEQEAAQLAAPAHAPSRWSSKSMRRKGSNGSAEEKAKSLGVSLLHHSIHNIPPWSGSQDKLKELNRHASMTSLREGQARTYSTVDSEGSFGLSTILSGMPTTTFDGRSDSRSTLSHSTAHKYSQVQRDLYQQQAEADFVMGPSKYKQFKDSLKKKSDEDDEMPMPNKDLRRKMESMALGVRFGAFNVKRKIERGIKG